MRTVLGEKPSVSVLPTIVVVACLLCASLGARAQVPDTFTNLRILPEDITRDSLLTVMRDFSFALDVRCQYCHVGGDGVSFEGVEFDRDDDPDKRKAREMLRMLADLNGRVLANLPERDEPPVTMECKTCHRGLARPALLKQAMRNIIDHFGVDSAVAFYRSERASAFGSGVYDFREWEVNVLAERLDRDGQLEAAAAVYALNAEFYPESISIALALGELYEKLNDVPNAVHWYQRVLELRPDHPSAVERLRALRGG